MIRWHHADRIAKAESDARLSKAWKLSQRLASLAQQSLADFAETIAPFAWAPRLGQRP
jgi:hypothetical protein